jgi:hypothetical protein
MRKTIAVLLVASTVAPALAADQQTDRPRRGRGRVVGAIVGAAGGFALGLFGGLTWFDDAVDSERKIWGTALGVAAAGGVAGYFVGRSLDPGRRGQRGAALAAAPRPVLPFRQLGRTPAAATARPFARLFEIAPGTAGPRGALETGTRTAKGLHP